MFILCPFLSDILTDKKKLNVVRLSCMNKTPQRAIAAEVGCIKTVFILKHRIIGTKRTTDRLKCFTVTEDLIRCPRCRTISLQTENRQVAFVSKR